MPLTVSQDGHSHNFLLKNILCLSPTLFCLVKTRATIAAPFETGRILPHTPASLIEIIPNIDGGFPSTSFRKAGEPYSFRWSNTLLHFPSKMPKGRSLFVLPPSKYSRTNSYQYDYCSFHLSRWYRTDTKYMYHNMST